MKILPSRNELKDSVYSSVFEELQEALKDSKNIPSEPKNFFVPEYQKPSNKIYANELKKQIENDYIKKLKTLEDRKSPGISEKFSGYPDRPETPAVVRKRKEFEKKMKLRQDLLEQIENKQKNLKIFKEIELKSNNDALFDSKEKKNFQKKNFVAQSWNHPVSVKLTKQLSITPEVSNDTSIVDKNE